MNYNRICIINYYSISTGGKYLQYSCSMSCCHWSTANGIISTLFLGWFYSYTRCSKINRGFPKFEKYAQVSLMHIAVILHIKGTFVQTGEWGFSSSLSFPAAKTNQIPWFEAIITASSTMPVKEIRKDLN